MTIVVFTLRDLLLLSVLYPEETGFGEFRARLSLWMPVTLEHYAFYMRRYHTVGFFHVQSNWVAVCTTLRIIKCVHVGIICTRAITCPHWRTASFTNRAERIPVVGVWHFICRRGSIWPVATQTALDVPTARLQPVHNIQFQFATVPKEIKV